MSLRAFHVLFITLSVLLALGCGGVAFRDYAERGGTLQLVFGIGSILVAVGLVIYERYFLKKTRKLIL
jgi:hypothetical protein